MAISRSTCQLRYSGGTNVSTFTFPEILIIVLWALFAIMANELQGLAIVKHALHPTMVTVTYKAFSSLCGHSVGDSSG